MSLVGGRDSNKYNHCEIRALSHFLLFSLATFASLYVVTSEIKEDAGAAYTPEYRPLHDYRNVDVTAWVEQWFGALAELDPESERYLNTEHYVAAQLGLHPDIRESDHEDLNFLMELLSTIGKQNPFNPNSDSVIEQHQYGEWNRFRQLGLLLGRQIVRRTLDEAEHYAAFRIEQERAGTDFLTGAANRRGFVRRMAELYGVTDDPVRRDRNGKALEPLMLTQVYCDGNRFRWINNHLGHHIGDATIVEAAWLISDLFRESNAPIIFRHGGDEFGVVLEIEAPMEAHNLINRIACEQYEKVTSSQYYDLLNAIVAKINGINQSDKRLKVEARKMQLSQAERAAGEHPYHILYINGEAITELRNIITLSFGVATSQIANLEDMETQRRAAEVSMMHSKERMDNILDRLLGELSLRE